MNCPLPAWIPAGRLIASCVLVLAPGLAWPQTDGVTVTATSIITQTDTVPRFCGAPSMESTSSGVWSSGDTWSTALVPAADARVRIAAGTEVVYDLVSDVELHCIEVEAGATLRFEVTRSTRLRVVHLTVLPGATFVVGETGQPVASDVMAEIIIPDRPLEVAGQDPAQFGNGLIVYGTLRMHGRAQPRTFIRLADDARAGDATLTLTEDPAGWWPGDTLVLPETRQIPFRKNMSITSRAELPVVQSVLGALVTLVAPLQHDHLGPRDLDGTVGPVEVSMRPHVGNLTRNVIVRSEAVEESPKTAYCEAPDHVERPETCITRGHTIKLRRADIDIRYVSFEHLGRTDTGDLNLTQIDQNGTVTAIGQNQVARYSVHTHHLIGPVNASNTGFQFRLIGNVVRGFLKWAIAIHGSHYGLIQGNIAYDGKASAIVAEDGTESFNVFDRNFVVHQGAGKPIDVLQTPSRAGVVSSRNGISLNGRFNFAFKRDCFWFTTPYNYVRDNVATNCTFGYNYNGYYTSRTRTIPKFRGADMATDGLDTQGLPALESTRNEAYGAIGQGLWMGWSRGCCTVALYQDESVFSGFRIWHANHSAVETYHETGNTFEGFIVRNDPDVSAISQGGSVRYNRGFRLGNPSYENGRVVIRDADIQGFNVGVEIPRNPTDGTAARDIFRLEDSRLRNHVNIEHRLSISSTEGDSLLRNLQFEPVALPVPGLPATPRDVWMHYTIDQRTNLTLPSRLFLYDLQGVPSDDYEVFFAEQGPNVPMPGDSLFDHPRFVGCPDDGLTNAECQAAHGVSIAGIVAPCLERDGDLSCAVADARGAALGIDGLVFPALTAAPPRVRFLAPAAATLTIGTLIDVSYATLGGTDPDDTVVLQLDTQPPVAGLPPGTNGHTFTHAVPGPHTVTGWLVRADGTTVAGSGTSLSLTTVWEPYTDDPLLAGVTLVRAVHFQELRTRINAYRVACGVLPVAFSGGVSVGAVIKTAHITEMRDALDGTYVACGGLPPVYADPGLAAGRTPIRAVHLLDLRNAITALE